LILHDDLERMFSLELAEVFLNSQKLTLAVNHATNHSRLRMWRIKA